MTKPKKKQLTKIFFYLLPTLVGIEKARADFDQDLMTFSLGMVNISYAESSSGLKSQSTDPDVANSGSKPASGSASVMSLDTTYDHFINSSKSFYGELIVPFTGAGANSYVYLGGGLNFYRKSFSTKGEFKNSDAEIKFIPKWRLYWGPNFGSGFLLYTAEFKKKSDMIIDIGIHGGANYTLGDKWGLKAEAGYSRGIGLNTMSSIMKIILGSTYYYD